MADATFRRGVQRLAARDMSFDAWLYHPQIAELTALARAIPEGSFVLDHLGGPLGIGPYEGQRAEILKRWRVDIAELATCPNVAMKLGGIGMVVFGLGFEEKPEPPTSEELADAWAVRSLRDRAVRRRPVHVRVQLPVDKMSCSSSRSGTLQAHRA